MKLFLSITIATGLCSLTALAQQTTGGATPPTPSDASQSPPATPDPTEQTQYGTSKKRLLFALPDFLTVENAGQVPPLTAGQKFKLAARGTFDYMEFIWYGALAGIGQAKGNEPEYGQGAEGYAKRYGEQFGDGTIENIMTKAAMPALLHQDPRYYQQGKGTVRHRTWYALSRTFITRSDSGTTQFNFSEVIGSGASAGISTYTYHPSGDRNFETVATTWGSQVGYDMISFVLKEFWPDLRRKFRKSK